MATTESSEVREFVHSVRRELITSAGLEAREDRSEELPPLPIAEPAEGTPAPTLADLPRPRARGTLPPPIPGVALKETPMPAAGRRLSPPPLPAAARTISLNARPTIKAPSTLIIPEHLDITEDSVDDSVDDSAETAEVDFPVLAPDQSEEWVGEPNSIDLPVRRKSHSPWIVGTIAFVVIAGGSALAAYLTLPNQDAPRAIAAPATTPANAIPTPVVTPIVVEPEATSIAIPPAPQAVVETPELGSRTTAVAAAATVTKKSPAAITRAAPTRTAGANKRVSTKTRAPAVKAPAIAAKTPAKKSAPAKADPGILMLGAKPPCAIFVDGKDTGLTTPQRSIELAPGKHKVTLVNTTYSIKKSFKVKITSGEKTRAIHDLTDAIKSR